MKLFRRAEELDMPIFLHAVQHGNRIVNIMILQQDGLDIFAPEEAQTILVSLVTSGLLHDFHGLNSFMPRWGPKRSNLLTGLLL